MYDGGSFYSDSNSSLGNTTSPGEYSLKWLHVQDRGTFELHSFDKNANSQISVTNLSVSTYTTLRLSYVENLRVNDPSPGY